MTAGTRFLCCLGLASIALAAPGNSQATPSDSLRVELERLRARLDSLEQLLRSRGITPAPDTARQGDELARLRARARAAAAQADTTSRTRQTSGGNLNRLNPEISVTGDVRAMGTDPGPQEDVFRLREVELSFQSALDPFASTKLFLSLEEGAINIEEGYLYWPGLVGRLRLDLGVIRQQFGELNRWHLHALPESEYPLVLRKYFGDEGLAQTGVSLYTTAPISIAAATHEVWAQVAVGNNDGLFDGGNRLSYLAHLNNFWQLSPATFFQVGGTALYGENPDVGLYTTTVGTDWRFTWRPPERALYREFTIRGEAIAVKRAGPVSDGWRWGGFVGAQYRLGRRWIAGLRYDYVQEPEGPITPTWALVPSLTYWQSEWVYARVEFQHLEGRAIERTRSLLLQIVWSFGPHKHETY